MRAAGTNSMTFALSEEAKAFLLREGTDERYGARHLKRALERHLVQPISNLMATGQAQGGDRSWWTSTPAARAWFFSRSLGKPHRKGYSKRPRPRGSRRRLEGGGFGQSCPGPEGTPGLPAGSTRWKVPRGPPPQPRLAATIGCPAEQHGRNQSRCSRSENLGA